MRRQILPVRAKSKSDVIRAAKGKTKKLTTTPTFTTLNGNSISLLLVQMQAKDISRHQANDTLKQFNRGVKWSKEDLNVKGQQWKERIIRLSEAVRFDRRETTTELTNEASVEAKLGY